MQNDMQELTLLDTYPVGCGESSEGAELFKNL
jgi:hypothetical protein